MNASPTPYANPAAASFIPVITGTKQPALRAGFTYSQFLPGEVRYPDWNPAAGWQWGLVCARQVELFVIDVDYPDKYIHSATWVQLDVADATVRRGDHYHIYVMCACTRYPRQGATLWGDVKANGLVLCAGSLHPSGAAYEATGEPMQACTPALHAALDEDKTEYDSVKQIRRQAVTGTATEYKDYTLGQILCIPAASIAYDNDLRDIVWALVQEGCDEDEAREQWDRLALALTTAWEERDFLRHYRGAHRKYCKQMAGNDALAQMKGLR